MRARLVLLAVLLTAIPAACGSGAARVGGVDRNTIMAEEIDPAANATAWDVVERLRPHFLQRRGASSITQRDADTPVVYVDGLRRGDLNELRQVPASVIARIDYVSAVNATTRWGTNHPAGVIAIQTKR
jgi:hypothetical protein